MNTETLQARAARLVQNEVLCCVSSLVHTLAGAYGVDVDGRNGRDLVALAEQAFDLSTPIDDWEETARDAGWKPYGGLETGQWWRDGEAGPDGAVDMIGATSAQDACEQDDIEPYQREVFEHWAVSTWLADKLLERGEKVDKNFGNLCVWARTTTGQAISIDHVIEEITRELHA